MRHAAAAVAAFALVLLALAGGTIRASANGVPQVVKLTYLEGVSNWGPKDAEGVLEISFAEAHARVDVKRLPPATGVSLEGWLVAADGKAALVGKIPTEASGVGALDAKLPALDRTDYNTFVVAARTEADTPGALPKQKSVAGRFTVLKDDPASVKKGGNETRPGLLPETGQAPAEDDTWRRLGFTLSVMTAVAGVAIVAIRQVQRRKAGPSA